MSLPGTMGCTGSSTYHRSALTPLPQPALTGAGTFRGRSQLTVGTTLSSTVRAHEGTNPEEVNPDGESVSFSDGEANWVPRTQANLIFKHTFGRYFAMGLIGITWDIDAPPAVL